MGSTTSRLALPYPVGSDSDSPPADIQRLANALDANTVVYLEGTAAARPAAGAHGRFYYCTDTNAVYYDYGAGWIQINLSPVSQVQAKGDVLVGSGTATVARLPAGNDYQVLQSLAGATNGVQWGNVLGLPVGAPGATAPARFVGGTAQGPPVTGSFNGGDFVVDQTGELWVCYQAGSPGAWRPAHSPAVGQPLLLVGAGSACRFVGGTTSGPPTQGTFYVGDFVIDQTGGVWVNVQSGSPGLWSGLIKHAQFTAYQSVTQVVVSSTWVTLSFDTVSIDTDDGHDPDDPTIYRCQRAGTFDLIGSVALPGLSGTVQGIGVRLLLNGNPIVGTTVYQVAVVNGLNAFSCMPATIQLQVGDVVQVQAWHDATAAASTSVSRTDVRCRFNARQNR